MSIGTIACWYPDIKVGEVMDEQGRVLILKEFGLNKADFGASPAVFAGQRVAFRIAILADGLPYAWDVSPLEPLQVAPNVVVLADGTRVRLL